MTEWRTFIDPSVGDGQNTINGIIADGSTFGVGISSHLNVTGITTFADNVNVNSDIYVQGDLRLDGKIKDGDNNFGSSGQVLSSDGTDTRWVNAGTLSAGAASQVAINDDSNTNASRYLTFVDSSSGNNSVKTDPQLTYNPSTNVISTAGVDLSDNSRIRFGANNDLRISHTNDLSGQNDSNGDSVLDGNNYCSYIHENGAGPLIFKSNGGPSTGAYHFYDTSWRPILKLFSGTGARAALYYAGSEKLITASSGVTITGTATATAFSGPLTGNVTGNISGNAGTATILANTRTIGGVSFNGSANINLPGVNQAGNQNTSGNAATATVLETTRNFSISGEITANAQSFNGSGNVTLSATVDNNVIDEANLKISNSPTNGRFLQCNTGVSGGLTWAEVTVPSANTLSGTTLASGITASSITSLGTLTGLSVDGNVSVTGTVDGRDLSSDGSKLDGIDSGAKDDQTKAEIDALNINADQLDGQHGSYYRNASNLNDGTVPDARLSSSSLFVSGMIMLWSGSTGSIPSGWVLCNGQNSTPDLRDRFIIGAGNNYNVNATGGESSKLLGTANLPSHTHQLGGNVGNANLSHSHSWSGTTDNNGSHSHDITDRSSQDSGDGYQGYREGSGGSGSNNVNSSTNGGHTHSVGGNTNSQLGNHNHSLPATTSDQGGTMGQSFSILPPYYALCYIMKT